MVQLMKRLTVSDTENMIMAIQDEIRRNDTSRYDHRLHGVLLVAHGLTSVGSFCEIGRNSTSYGAQNGS